MDGNWYDDPDAEIPRPGKNPPVAKRKRNPGPRTTRKERASLPVADTRCGSRKQDGRDCTLPAGYGTEHPGYGPCKHHFGDTPAGRKSGAIDMAQELVRFYAEPIDTDPITALLDEVSRTAGYVQWLSEHLGRFNIPVHELDDKGKKVPAGIPPSVSGWVAVWQAERQQLVRVSKAALDAGVNERLVQIAEHQGARLGAAVEEILLRLQLSPAQKELVPRVVPDVLRGLVSGAPRMIEGTIEEDQ